MSIPNVLLTRDHLRWNCRLEPVTRRMAVRFSSASMAYFSLSSSLPGSLETEDCVTLEIAQVPAP